MKILLLDVETSAHEAFVWNIWNVNVGLNMLRKEGGMICWAAKWYGEKEMHFASVVERGGEKRMVQKLHKMMMEADVIVHYNGNKFDIPVINKSFILHGLNPTVPAKQVDLLRVVKRKFRFVSNKLEYVAKQLGIGQKAQTGGFDLWVKCMEKDPAAWIKMEKYNRQDVVLLEKLYVKLLPWVPNHPNRTLDSHETAACPTCLSESFQRRGYYRTAACTYQRYQCCSCGSWFRSGQREQYIPPSKKKLSLPG